MPSLLHKAITDLVGDTPALAVRLAFPDWAHDTPAVLRPTELAQSSLMADLVLLLGGPPPTHTLVVEVQLQVDRDKRFVWPAYVSAAHHRHRLPVSLLIITPSREVAQAARAPLSFDGHGPTLQPVVIGPDELPVLTRPEDAAKDLDYAALSALAHMHHPDRGLIAAAVLQALRDLPEGTAVSYHQLMRAVLGPIEEGETMLKPYRLYVPETIALVAEAEQRGRAEGEARGEARGRTEGEARGEARGQLEGHRAGLRFGWAARFGAAPMPAAVEEALQAADLDTIMRAGPALLGAQDAEAAAAALLAALVGSVAG
ncbi:MAG: hypothetical protein JNM72_04260 [Deltaproteobacteria bacterium]|nr:hypothetical protein [Deltaproteobacteria bacterium]